MNKQELKEAKKFCNLLTDIAKDVCKNSNLCNITEKGCRRHTFEENNSLCCRHCKHLEIGVGCKVNSISCAMGGCYHGWITANGVAREAVNFFGEEHLNTLTKLALLRKIIYDKYGAVLYTRLSVDESFSKNARKYMVVAEKRYFRQERIARKHNKT